jgi:2-polyprenyl-3-methyl-5-hydroxy-6-metoxy-1,4-benzoquinol methylase
MMEEAKCALCGEGGSSKPYLLARGEEEYFRYHRCAACGLVYLNPRPAAREILQYYDQEYYGEGKQKFHPWIEVFRIFFARQRVRRVKRFIAGKGQALDIGCGQGTFLNLLRKEGWEVFGTELSEKQAGRAMEAALPVSIGELREGQFPAESLDLVTLWQVIEHLFEPGAVIRCIRPMLKKRGIVAISTPNIDSLQAHVFKESWFHLDPPRHLYLFSLKTLEQLMAQEGFRLFHLRHLSFEQDPYGWLQSSLNRMSFAENTLYAFIKNKARNGTALNPWELWRNLLFGAGLFPTSLILSSLLGWRHKGGTIEAYFEKGE